MICPNRACLACLLVVALRCAALAEDKVLYEKQSRYNTIVVTENDQGLRTLLFEKGGARQSAVKLGQPDHLELAYARAMPLGLALVEEPKRVLIIGLGGGTIPGFLHKHYPRTVIDVVDIDPGVVEVAKKFFGFREDERMHAYAKDGRRFIEETRDPYDIIFLDAYGADNIPYDLATREFLQAVQRALTPRGIVVGNVWSAVSNHLHDDMLRTYLDVFGGLYDFSLQEAENEIFIAQRSGPRIEKDEFARRAKKVAQDGHFPMDLGDLATNGYRYEDGKNAGGKVLRDKASRNNP